MTRISPLNDLSVVSCFLPYVLKILAASQIRITLTAEQLLLCVLVADWGLQLSAVWAKVTLCLETLVRLIIVTHSLQDSSIPSENNSGITQVELKEIRLQ